MRIVDLLEVIDINQTQHKCLLLALPLQIELVQRLIERFAVGQAGQAIGASLRQVVGNLVSLRFKSLLGRIKPMLELLVGLHDLREKTEYLLARCVATALHS